MDMITQTKPEERNQINSNSSRELYKRQKSDSTDEWYWDKSDSSQKIKAQNCL